MNLVKVCKILSTHGLNGYVKVQPYCDFEILEKHPLIIKDNHHLILSVVSNAGKCLICKIGGIKNVDDAKKFCNLELFIERKELGSDVIISDVIGFTVLVNDSKYGIVKDYGDYGSGALLEIETNKTGSKGQKISENYLFTMDNFPNIDIQNHTIQLAKQYD